MPNLLFARALFIKRKRTDVLILFEIKILERKEKTRTRELASYLYEFQIKNNTDTAGTGLDNPTAGINKSSVVYKHTLKLSSGSISTTTKTTTPLTATFAATTKAFLVDRHDQTRMKLDSDIPAPFYKTPKNLHVLP